MIYKITKTYIKLIEAGSFAEATVADARHEITWTDEDVINLTIEEVSNDKKIHG